MVFSDDQGYRLAHITYLVSGQGGMARYLDPFHLRHFTMGDVVYIFGDVLSSNHGHHPR